jgi:hypothetical protein
MGRSNQFGSIKTIMKLIESETAAGQAKTK